MPTTRSHLSRRAVDALLNAALNAQRRGTLGDLGARHSRMRRMLWQQWLNPVAGTLGDAQPHPERASRATRLLLAWAVSRLRPDGKSGLGEIDEVAWLHSTSWRPMLALACHHGLLAIPAFPSRYRRSAEEGPVENLCGLWTVGPSTVYRYLDKAKRQLSDFFAAWPVTAEQVLALRMFLEERLLDEAEPDAGWAAWHTSQGKASLLAGHIGDGLWHLWRAGDIDSLLATLRRHGTEAASSGETDALLSSVGPSLTAVQHIELALCWAHLWHLRNAVDREGEVLDQALRHAQSLEDPLYVGMALAAMARFLQSRDRDRAMACFEEGIVSLRKVVEAGASVNTARAGNEYARCLAELAWLNLRRSNPKAKALLDQIPAISAQIPLLDETVGSIEQIWGEYWRCVGNPRRALEHKHKALIIFQRLGDQRSVLSTYNNLSLIYGDAKEYAQSLEYGNRVVAAASTQPIEPEVLAGVLCNLGVTYFSLGQLTEAIDHYERSRQLAQEAGLRAQLVIALYNLAEAHYERFKLHGDDGDEALGDALAASAAKLSTEDNAHAQADAARSLKREVLGTGEGPDRLLPSEHAAHFAEMAEVERLRLTLAAPQPAAQQVRTHLAIAQAYLAIATKEREAALAIAARHGLAEDFGGELNALRQTFERELTREQQWDSRWQQLAGELLQPAQRGAALTRLMTVGAINKSGYAEVCGVSLATASKHLGLLAERGLLVQTGKGPSTRYLLPDSLN